MLEHADVMLGRGSVSVKLALLLAFVAALAPAQEPVPRGSEFQVNTYTTNDQERAEVSPRGADGFVVAWDSLGSSGGDDDDYSIQAQYFDSRGQTVGFEFQVNEWTTGSQHSPAVGLTGAGGFVIAWSSDGSSGTDTDDASIQARCYASDGTPLVEEFQVNSYTTNSQTIPAIGPSGAGGFVVAWTSLGSAGSDTFARSIQAQVFSPECLPVGEQFQVNTYTTSFQTLPVVASDGADGFVVVWESDGSLGTDNDNDSIQAQLFSSDGAPVGNEFQVNSYWTSIQRLPSVAPTGPNSFLVIWHSAGSVEDDDSGYSTQAQRYSSSGVPLGGQFQVNTYTTASQVANSIGPDGAGGFVITWQSDRSYGSDDSGTSIQGQRFSQSGVPLGGEFQVNTYTPDSQRASRVASDGGQGFVVVWRSEGSAGDDQSLSSVQAQRWAVPDIFEDGFESGDTSAWSTVVP